MRSLWLLGLGHLIPTLDLGAYVDIGLDFLLDVLNELGSYILIVLRVDVLVFLSYRIG